MGRDADHRGLPLPCLRLIGGSPAQFAEDEGERGGRWSGSARDSVARQVLELLPVGPEVGKSGESWRHKARQQAHRNIARHLHRSYAQIVLDRIVSGYLLDKAAEDAGVVIEEEAVDAEVEKSLSKLETQEDIDAYFDSVGLDARSYRDLIRRQLYHKQFLTEVYEVRVTEQEAQDHYKRYKRRYDKKAEVKASHILFKFSSSRPSPEEVEKKSKPTLDDDYDPVFLPRSYCVRIPPVLFSLQI